MSLISSHLYIILILHHFDKRCELYAAILFTICNTMLLQICLWLVHVIQRETLVLRP